MFFSKQLAKATFVICIFSFNILKSLGNPCDSVVRVESSTFNFCFLEPHLKKSGPTVSGSGFFISKNEIVTNYHVVENIQNVRVQYKDLLLDVDVSGVCPSLDIALLKLTNESEKILYKSVKKITPLKIGNSDILSQGNEVITLGYPLGAYTPKLTKGIISGTKLVEIIHQDLFIQSLQIDAAVNQGSSGGPCINQNNEIVGICFCSFDPSTAQNTNFIIPINLVSDVFEKLRTQKIVRKVPFSTIEIQPVEPVLSEWLGKGSEGGVFCSKIQPDSLFSIYGLKDGDVIVSINGFPIDSHGRIDPGWSGDEVFCGIAAERLLRQKGLELKVFRQGKFVNLSIPIPSPELIEKLTPKIRFKFPFFEDIDYQFVGGCVFTELCSNHIAYDQSFCRIFIDPNLQKFLTQGNNNKTKIIATSLISTTIIERNRAGMMPGSILETINDQPIYQLSDIYKIIKKCFIEKDRFIVMGFSNGTKVPLPLNELFADDVKYSRLYYLNSKQSPVLKILEELEKDKA